MLLAKAKLSIVLKQTDQKRDLSFCHSAVFEQMVGSRVLGSSTDEITGILLCEWMPLTASQVAVYAFCPNLSDCKMLLIVIN